MVDSKDNLINLEEERSKIYGDPLTSHLAIGYAWRGVLQNRFHDITIPEIPPDLVAEMLAAFKVIRLARPVFHQDSADDAHVYIKFSERWRQASRDNPNPLLKACQQVQEEYQASIDKHPNNPKSDLKVLVSEIGEVADATAEGDDRLKQELAQVAATAIRWIERLNS